MARKEFSDKTKYIARSRSDFKCVMCRTEFAEEVHHIDSQEDNILGNAAPLCFSCHGKYGSNQNFKKRIRTARDDLWKQNEKKMLQYEKIYEKIKKISNTTDNIYKILKNTNGKNHFPQNNIDKKINEGDLSSISDREEIDLVLSELCAHNVLISHKDYSNSQKYFEITEMFISYFRGELYKLNMFYKDNKDYNPIDIFYITLISCITSAFKIIGTRTLFISLEIIILLLSKNRYRNPEEFLKEYAKGMQFAKMEYPEWEKHWKEYSNNNIKKNLRV